MLLLLVQRCCSAVYCFLFANAYSQVYVRTAVALCFVWLWVSLSILNYECSRVHAQNTFINSIMMYVCTVRTYLWYLLVYIRILQGSTDTYREVVGVIYVWTCWNFALG